MKFLLIYILFPFSTLLMPTDAPFSSVETAFNIGDAAKVVSFSKDKILLSVLGKEGAYSQNQATLILKDFFSKKPCSSFKFILKGKDTEEGSYAIGTYYSKSDKYRIGVNFKKNDESYRIDSISIEKS